MAFEQKVNSGGSFKNDRNNKSALNGAITIECPPLSRDFGVVGQRLASNDELVIPRLVSSIPRADLSEIVPPASRELHQTAGSKESLAKKPGAVAAAPQPARRIHNVYG